MRCELDVTCHWDGRTHGLASWACRNVDCDYSSAYLILRSSSPGLKGVGMTFTIGRGNDIVRPDPFLLPM